MAVDALENLPPAALLARDAAAGAARAGAGGGNGLPCAATARSIPLTTRSASASRPCETSQRGDSGRRRTMKKTSTSGSVPR